MRTYIAGLLIIGTSLAYGQAPSGGGQTKDAPSGWTTDTIKSHYDELNASQLASQRELRDTRQKFMDERYADTQRRIDDVEKQNQLAVRNVQLAADLALSNVKESNAKADAATEARFASINEFRGQLKDQAATLLPRSEFQIAQKGVVDSISSIADRITNGNRELTARLDTLATKVTENTAANAGSSSTWGMLGVVTALVFTGIASIAGLAGFIYMIVTRKRAAARN